MKRRVSGIVTGVAVAAGAGLVVPTTAGALEDVSGKGLPVIYEAPVSPEVARFVYDTGVAVAVADFGHAIADPHVSWIVSANAEMLDDVSYDIVVDGYACGEIGMRGEGGLSGAQEVVGTSFARC